MLQINRQNLPTSDELLDSDDTPVDNEDQNFVPNVLLFLLEYIWKSRDDWFFAVDMGVYHPVRSRSHIASITIAGNMYRDRIANPSKRQQ
ncbi:hypothetical protein V2H45_11120 [Tumidithrix elongata RA019]|uniref:Uncharacterized protein n=1 Tax=Tumidithrix elongata BACA0141 TaxID=2716417 RepID=A0AAW9Q240_9CYAN|nr:hypothetical protein [Tumidithrix elongata RA019]